MLGTRIDDFKSGKQYSGILAKTYEAVQAKGGKKDKDPPPCVPVIYLRLISEIYLSPFLGRSLLAIAIVKSLFSASLFGRHFRFGDRCSTLCSLTRRFVGPLVLLRKSNL